ncbi:MAG: pyrroline-5-carboxylate reductase [Phycisphaeraceae bacterium]|nr:pyrroline-5-carboxylate reductase [Phycisphaeraceae bacterium]
MQKTSAVVVIGGGSMGRAVVVANHRRDSDSMSFVVAEPDQERRAALESIGFTGVRLVPSAVEALRSAASGAVIVLAVKPQVFPGVAAELTHSRVLGEHLVISIMAGRSAESVHAAMTAGATSSASVRVVRAMPNLPLAHGAGMTAIAAGPGAGSADLAFASRLFATGEVLTIDEALFDAFTAVAGSGPAYVFYLAEAMERAARELGFSAMEARTMVRQTIAGAAEMLKAEQDDPARLRERVTSKGGVTAAAVAIFDQQRVADAVARALENGRNRARELTSA